MLEDVPGVITSVEEPGAARKELTSPLPGHLSRSDAEQGYVAGGGQDGQVAAKLMPGDQAGALQGPEQGAVGAGDQLAGLAGAVDVGGGLPEPERAGDDVLA